MVKSETEKQVIGGGFAAKIGNIVKQTESSMRLILDSF